jgi:hypothetical protein
LLEQVDLDERLRERVLAAYDLEAVLLEPGPARAALAERLALCNQTTSASVSCSTFMRGPSPFARGSAIRPPGIRGYG